MSVERVARREHASGDDRATHVEGARTRLRQPGHLGRVALQQGRHGRVGGPRSGTPANSSSQSLASRRSARAPGAASTTWRMSIPSRQGLVEGDPHRVGLDALGHRDLEVLRLAARAGGRSVGIADLRVRVEARREGHRHVRPAQRPLERALEVAARGEPQPPPLRVADPELLDRGVRCRTLGDALTCLTSHARKANRWRLTARAGRARASGGQSVEKPRRSSARRCRSAVSASSSRVASARVGAVPPRLAGRYLRSGPVSGS